MYPQSYFTRNVNVRNSLWNEVGAMQTSAENLSCVREYTHISDTGATFIEVPMTMTKSTTSLSCSVRRSKNVLGSFSPKKVIFGCTHHQYYYLARLQYPTFITPASGMSYCPSESSSEKLDLPRLLLLLAEPRFLLRLDWLC